MAAEPIVKQNGTTKTTVTEMLKMINKMVRGTAP